MLGKILMCLANRAHRNRMRAQERGDHETVVRMARYTRTFRNAAVILGYRGA
jgi:hypothetical protein